MTDPGFEAFVSTRGDDLWRSAWLLTGDRHKAEDLVQTALTKTFPKYRGSDLEFEVYVRTTMYRTYCSWWRRKWRGEVPTEVLPDVAEERGQSEVSIDLARALAALPTNQRAVLVLRYYEDRSTVEAAELLGLAEGTVKAYASRALETLRKSRHLREETS